MPYKHTAAAEGDFLIESGEKCSMRLALSVSLIISSSEMSNFQRNLSRFVRLAILCTEMAMHVRIGHVLSNSPVVMQIVLIID